jgi:drug/metabolite transporter (DMT)-like permease
LICPVEGIAIDGFFYLKFFMRKQLSHRAAIAVMACAALMWSIAGVLTRQLEVAAGFEITFWRSLFSGLFVFCVLAWQNGKDTVQVICAGKGPGILSGLMWSVMFCCFMLALTKTTVANTLIVMSLSPLLTALLALAVLRQRIAPRTWIAIAIAFLGMLWMFAGNVEGGSRSHLVGMLIAFGVPVAASINFIVMKKAGQKVDLVPSVLLGSVMSLLVMLPLAWPLQASAHDIVILTVLGVFQLGLPCMMMVVAARSLSAPEISLLALLEVVFGPLWAWLGAGEAPGSSTLAGGAVVLAALALNELMAMQTRSREPAGNTA